jgi:CubicO group peptidase (beta-lactamase class C family)
MLKTRLVCFAVMTFWAAHGQELQEANSLTGALKTLTSDVMEQYKLKSLLVQVRYNGHNLYTEARGESMTGVPATSRMHFRNGAMAFTYMSTMLLELIDQRPKEVSLDDPLSKYLPGLPHSDRITLKNLSNFTSGYADYVYQPEFQSALYLNPFRQWTTEELIQIGISKPMQFEPGTNWGYAHTNYAILGRILEKITGLPLAEAMRRYIFVPMGLKQTQGFDTPQIPDPVLHAFSSERRPFLLIPEGTPFYEESTFWSPSWATAEGAVQTTDITDMSKSMEVVGTGALLSPASFAAQVAPNLIGFGHPDPNCNPDPSNSACLCVSCRTNTAALNYGLGVVNLGSWISQTKLYAGSAATVGYLPGRKLTVAVVTTYNQDAFDQKGDYINNANNASGTIFKLIANALAPNSLAQ